MSDWIEKAQEWWGYLKSPADPLSALTGGLYILAGLAPLLASQGPTAVIFAVYMTVLGVGTSLRHIVEKKWTHTADHLGMHLVFAFLSALSIGVGWPVAAIASLVAAVVLELYLNLRLKPSMGIYMAVITLGLVQAQLWWMLTAFYVFMGGGAAAKFFTDDSDQWHGLVWHPFTGIGILVAFMTLLGV